MKKRLGLLAVGGLLIAAAPMTGIQAASLINPTTSASTASNLNGTGVTEVRWHWRRHHHWRRHWGWRHRHHWHHWR